MIDSERGFFLVVEDGFDTFLLLEKASDLRFPGRIIEVNMGDLMVGNGEDFAGAAIEQFMAQFIFNGEPAFSPEDTVQMDGPVHVGDAVFGQEDDLNGWLAEIFNETSYDVIDGEDIG